jgi:2-polyprenyl-6-methoxyphenol hydroxylase-like FAD-dependent oxidoreductase
MPGVTARLRRDGGIDEVPAGWVLGCDGAHCKVRDGLGVSFEGTSYPERFVLADIAIDDAVDHEKAKVWLPAEGAVALFPLPHGRWRLILANAPDDWPVDPGLAQCQALLDARLPAGSHLTDPPWISLFRIHRRIAGHFRHGHAFPLRNAGHIYSPVGGQGVNMGIQDAFNLAWKNWRWCSAPARSKPCSTAMRLCDGRSTRRCCVRPTAGPG